MGIDRHMRGKRRSTPGSDRDEKLLALPIGKASPFVQLSPVLIKLILSKVAPDLAAKQVFDKRSFLIAARFSAALARLDRDDFLIVRDVTLAIIAWSVALFCSSGLKVGFWANREKLGVSPDISPLRFTFALIRARGLAKLCATIPRDDADY